MAGDPSDRAREPPGPRRRLLALIALALLPWTVVVADGTTTLVFAFGLLDAGSLYLTTLTDFLLYAGGLESLPQSLRAWPVSVGIFLCAVVSAVGGVIGVEDPRVTGGLLALAGLSHLPVAIGVSRALSRWALPVGPAVLVAAAWWLYWPAVQANSADEQDARRR